MILAHMLSVGEDILKCDMAETYQVYIPDWYDPPFPMSFLADLAVGLNENSRIKRQISKQRLTLDQTLQAMIVDKLSILIWQNTKDGQKGRNVPKSLTIQLSGLDEKKKDDYEVFDSIEDYERWYKEKHHG